jgi:hypothetical protein
VKRWQSVFGAALGPAWSPAKEQGKSFRFLKKALNFRHFLMKFYSVLCSFVWVLPVVTTVVKAIIAGEYILKPKTPLPGGGGNRPVLFGR